MIKVAVLGAAGRMGSTVVRAVENADGLALAAALDMDDEISTAVDAGAQVAVEFTVPETSEANVHALIDAGIHAVVGTSGWSEAALKRVEEHLADKPEVGVLVAPNFALGAVFAMKLSEMAAPYFESVEVVELHHPDKFDAPSGTAMHTAAGIAAARKAAGVKKSPDATVEQLDGARGADVEGVKVHSVRLRGLVAHEEVLFGNPGEMLTIRHDSLDRESFMPGVVLAVREIVSRPGLAVGLDNYLDL